ncbi:hypothetical protein M8S83_15210 [Enterobacter asburiae]|uniref:hypothetical protein n=1 Tax=Enterobacter asburiae TaxID=61645 RepID=UPI00207519B4|nr:hypothetical protein [Enterobacter asburiae]MCM7773455.1 hypothetical protein [Enterobacter asburiae]
MRQLTSQELQQTSGGLSSSDIMNFIRGLFGSKDNTPSTPWTSPVTPPSTGKDMGGVIGAIVVGTVAVLAFGLSKLLDSASK